MQEREISLMGMFFDILLRWRAIIVAMLVGAVLLGGVNFVQSYRTSNAQAAKVEAAKKQLEQEMQAAEEATNKQEDVQMQADQEVRIQLAQVSREWLEERITDTQKYNVNYVLTYEELYRDKLAYTEQSVLMQMDPNDVKKSEVTFLVSSDDMERTYNVVKVYEDIVRGGELFEIIAEEMETDTSNVSEIISLEKESYSLLEGTNTLRLKVIHYDEAICQDITQVIIDYLNTKCSDMADKLGNHELSVLTQSMVAVADTNVMSQQRSYLMDIVSMESEIVTYKSKFTDIEWQYYDFMRNGKITELSVDKVTTASAAEEEEDESLTDIINKGVTVQPGVSIKYIILGAILAAFVYVFVVFLLYILNTRIRATDKLQDLYKIPYLGLISQDNKSKKFLGFIDDIIISLRDRNKRKFTREEALNLAAVAVKMAAGKESLNCVYFVGCDLKDQALAACRQLQKLLSEDGVKAGILNNVLYDAQAMSDLEEAKCVVLVEKAGSTLYTEIAQELELLKRLDIKVLGGIVVE